MNLVPRFGCEMRGVRCEEGWDKKGMSDFVRGPKGENRG